MNIDWQTVFYVMSTITMIAFFTLIIAIVLLVRKVKSVAEKSVSAMVAARSIAKISVLRTLLKLIR